MFPRLFQSRVLKALAIAGKCAIVFAPTFFVFLFAAILMVSGSGTSPAVTYLSATIVSYSSNLLGVSSDGAIVPTVMLWSLVLYVLVFSYRLFFHNLPSNTDQEDLRQIRRWALFSLIIAVAVPLALASMRHSANNAADEIKLALEFVKQNSTVLREVGGDATFDLISYRKSGNGSVTFYDISVQGTKTVYAIVDVSRESGRPIFSLGCTTPLYLGMRDPYKHPCSQ